MIFFLFLQPFQVSIEEKITVEPLPYVVPDTFPSFSLPFRQVFVEEYFKNLLDDFEKDLQRELPKESYIAIFLNSGKIHARGKDSLVLYFYKRLKKNKKIDKYFLYSEEWRDTLYSSYIKLFYAYLLFFAGDKSEAKIVLKDLKDTSHILKKWKNIAISLIECKTINYNIKYATEYNAIVDAIDKHQKTTLLSLLSNGLPYYFKPWAVIELIDHGEKNNVSILKYIEREDEFAKNKDIARIVHFIKAIVNFHRTYDKELLKEYFITIPDTTDMIFEISFVLYSTHSNDSDILISPSIVTNYIDNLRKNDKENSLWHSLLSYITGVLWYKIGDTDNSVKMFRKSITFGTDSLFALFPRISLMWLNMAENKYQLFSSVYNVNSKNLNDFINLYNGMVYFYKKDYQQAIMNYTKVKNNNTLKMISLWYISLSYEWKGNINAAIDVLEDLYNSGLSDKPYSVIERIIYLCSQSNTDMIDKAEQWYTTFVSLYGEGIKYEDTYARIVVSLFDMYRKKNHTDKFRYFLSLLQTRLGRMDIVESYYYQRFTDADDITNKKFYLSGLEQVYSRSNYLPEMYFELGAEYFKKQNYQKATYYFENVKKWEDLDVIRDRLSELYFYLGFAYYKIDKIDEAINNFSIYYNYYRSEEYDLQALWLYGLSLFNKGELLRKKNKTYETYREFYSKARDIFIEYVSIENDENKIIRGKDLIHQCEVFLR